MKYYLAHHGVQNQHWGVRHGPPYPLDSNASKQAKRKSASKSSYDKLYGDKKGSTRHTGSASSVNNSSNNKMTKDEKRQMFELGKKATIYGKAVRQSDKNIKEAFTKMGFTDNINGYDQYIKQSKQVKKEYEKKYNAAKKDLETYRSTLVKKYGNDNVKKIKYNKDGDVNMRVLTGKQITKKALQVAASVAATGAAVALTFDFGSGAYRFAVRNLLRVSNQAGAAATGGAISEIGNNQQHISKIASNIIDGTANSSTTLSGLKSRDSKVASRSNVTSGDFTKYGTRDIGTNLALSAAENKLITSAAPAMADQFVKGMGTGALLKAMTSLN